MEMSKVMVKEGDVAIITCPSCREIKKSLSSITRKQDNGNLR